jgi:hypothetical protein
MKMEYEQKGESESPVGFEKLPSDALIGSHPVFLRRRPRDDEDHVPDPDDDRPPPPPPPRDPVSVPDFGFQIRPCLEDVSFPPGSPAPPGFDLVDAVIEAVRSIAGLQADIRHVCDAGSSHIGVWLDPSSDPVVIAARDRGTRLLNPIRGGESFAVFISTNFIKAEAQRKFDEAPKLTDHAGQPTLNGPVHITGHDVALQFPDKIITTIRGFDTTPWPDVNFKLITTDTFRISGSAVDIESDTDLDASVGIFIVLGIFFLPIFSPASIFFFGEGAYIGSRDPGDQGAGAGGAVADRIPRDVFLRGGIKFVPVYQRVVVTTPGVVAGGAMLVVPRDPAVSILGPRSISVSAGETRVTKAYQANTRDLLQPRFLWTGAGTASNDRAKVTSITFDLAGLDVGESTLREVRLTATDADNLTAAAAVMVRIFRTDPTVEEMGGVPPICKVRPWLPQCNPPDI